MPERPDASHDLGWSELLGRDIPVRWTSGDHYGLTDEENIPGIARTLSDILRDRRARPRPASSRV